MIKNKLINSIFVLMSFVFIGNVKALPDSFTIKAEGAGITLNNNHSLQIDTTHNASSEHNYPYFHVKNSSAGNIICVSGLGVNEPVPNLTCKTESWTSANQAKGVAYIINTIIGTGGNTAVSNEKYFWSEVLINAYLDTYSPSNSSYMNTYVIEAGAKIANTGYTYNQILTNAINYAKDDYSSSLSANKTSLTFTANSDGYYYSDPVTITSTTNYKLGNISNNKFSYDKNGDTYIFKIKSSDITLGGSESFSIKVTNLGKEYYTAQRYDCGSGYQDVTLTETEKKSESGNEITLSGIVVKSDVEIKVGKVDNKNEYIAGAKLQFQTEDQKKNNEEGTIITTTNSYSVISNLKEGVYYLTEVAAPVGYVLNSESVKIEIDSEGNVRVNNQIQDGVITISNNLIKVVINKISVVDKKLLPGATLEIQDEEGNVVKYCKDDKGNNIECRWVSTDEEYVIEGMPNGKYYLVEIVAPKGYVLSSEKVPFIIDGEKSIIKVEMKNALEVEVPDTLSSRSALLLAIAMFDIALGIGIITYVKKNRVKEQ